MWVSILCNLAKIIASFPLGIFLQTTQFPLRNVNFYFVHFLKQCTFFVGNFPSNYAFPLRNVSFYFVYFCPKNVSVLLVIFLQNTQCPLRNVSFYLEFLCKNNCFCPLGNFSANYAVSFQNVSFYLVYFCKNNCIRFLGIFFVKIPYKILVYRICPRLRNVNNKKERVNIIALIKFTRLIPYYNLWLSKTDKKWHLMYFILII